LAVGDLTSLRFLIPNPARAWLRRKWKAFDRQLFIFDRVTDWSVLRRVKPYRPDLGGRRGSYIDRFYIAQFIADNQTCIRGHVGEIESDQYTREFGGTRVQRSDILDINERNQRRTIAIDLTRTASAPESMFDCVICTQTLLLIYDISSAVRSLHKMLKPGGVLLVTVPGIAQCMPKHMLGGADGDWWRFTAQFVRRFFGEIFGSGNVDVATFGNVLTATAFLQGLVQEELTREELEYHDPDYQLIIGVKAFKRTGSGIL
jgi:SAM-dependent methyltransferase